MDNFTYLKIIWFLFSLFMLQFYIKGFLSSLDVAFLIIGLYLLIVYLNDKAKAKELETSYLDIGEEVKGQWDSKDD